MKNNLFEIEKNIRAMAKRYKNIRYSLGLVIVFLMSGVGAFSEDINSENNLNSENSSQKNIFTRNEINSSVDNLKIKFKDYKKENDKTLNGARLELIKLMEQGDQVVKSPWASWQFGINYFYSDHTGKYKGKGDKAEKYPYEGIFTRSSNIFHRHISQESKKYEDIVSEMSKETKILSGLKYGLNTTKKVKEPIVEVEFPATIRPKEVEGINLTKPPKENHVVIPKAELPHFEIPDDTIKPPPSTSASSGNSPSKSLPLTLSQDDYANIKKGNGETGPLVGNMENGENAGPISQTNIKGKNGKGRIEIIHNDTDKFIIKSDL